MSESFEQIDSVRVFFKDGSCAFLKNHGLNVNAVITQLTEERAALDAENERLRKFNDEALAHIAKEERKARGRLEIAEAENELLRKAGDAMMEVLESEIPFTAMNAVNGWLAAKEGGAK